MLTLTPSVVLSAMVKKTSLHFTKITKGYWLEAVEKYKRVATCVAIFPILGRSERR